MQPIIAIASYLCSDGHKKDNDDEENEEREG